MKNLVHTIIFLSCLSFSYGQTDELFKFTQINFTVEDGLPSNECHDILQDSLGYMWIATDRGLVKYDGYTFETYGFKQGLKKMSCLRLELDSENNIVIATMDSQVFVYSRDIGSIQAYPYQYHIDQYKSFGKLMDIQLGDNDNLFFQLEYIGVLEISQDGKAKLHRIDNLNKELAYVFQDHGVFMHCISDRGLAPDYPVFQKNKFYRRSNNQMIGFIDLLYRDSIYSDSISNIQATRAIRRAFKFEEFDVVFKNTVNYIFKEDKLIHKYLGPGMTDMQSLEYGFLGGAVDELGLSYYKNINSLVTNKGKKIIDKVSVAKIFLDKNSNAWIATLKDGIYFLKQSQFTKIEKLEGNITALESSDKTNQIYVVKDSRRLYSYDRNEEELNPVFQNCYENDIQHIEYFAPKRGLIINSNITAIAYSNGKSKMVNISYRNDQTTTSSKFGISFGDEYFLACPYNFFIYDDVEALPSLSAYDDFGLKMFRTNCGIRMPNNKILLGSNDGIYCLDKNQFYKLSIPTLDLNIRINGIIKFNEGVVFATQGAGIYYWDLKNDLYNLDSDKGLISDNIEQLYSFNDAIYVSSKSGFSMISDFRTDRMLIENFDKSDGLPSNVINDIIEVNGEVWIATYKGVVSMTDHKPFTHTESPIVEEVLVNNKIYEDGRNLNYLQRDIKYNFKTLDYTNLGGINYRYRLNEGDWNYTKTTTAEYPNLIHGPQKFEIQSQNHGGNWSTTATHQLFIDSPWWHWWSVRLLMLILFSWLIYGFFKYRTQRLRDKILKEREIRTLEKAALQAQMNPHFIFNCLNSIQNFIMKNEKDIAMNYLARFAKLIRKNLLASSEDKISLDEELEILDNYLALEQVRLKGKFKYEINYQTNLDVFKVNIPPMLIQPYIENAVIHGMKSKDKDGLIKLDFELKQNTLLITIFDNGVKNEKSSKIKNHKSLGMSITQKRLAFINEGVHPSSYLIQPSFEEDGTYVRIQIDISED